MKYFEVIDPVRAYDPERLSKDIPELQFIKGDFLGNFLSKKELCSNIIIGRSVRTTNYNVIQHIKDIGTKNIFCTNLDCDEMENVIHFPLGLEDQFTYYNYDKFDLLKKCRNDFNGTVENKIYLNFSLYTSRTARLECLRSFKSKKNTIIKVNNRINKFNLNDTITFYNDILSCRFSASPRGNGIDCHRMYEILLLGRIPVCLNNKVVEYFSRKLPILVLNNWNEFDVKSKQFLDNFNEDNYDFSILSYNYWINSIQKIIKGI